MTYQYFLPFPKDFFFFSIKQTIRPVLEFCCWRVNPLPDNLDSILEKTTFEKIMGKGENFGNQHFLFHTMFFKSASDLNLAPSKELSSSKELTF